MQSHQAKSECTTHVRSLNWVGAARHCRSRRRRSSFGFGCGVELSTSARFVVLLWIHSPSLARRVHNEKTLRIRRVCVCAFLTKAARYDCSLCCLCVYSVRVRVPACVYVCVCCVLRLPFVAKYTLHKSTHSQRNHF